MTLALRTLPTPSELSCSTMAKTIQQINRTGFHSEQTSTVIQESKKHKVMLISRSCLLKRMSAARMAAEEGVEGHCVSAQTITLIA